MSEAVFGRFGSDPSRPRDPFVDGLFRFQFLVIPARRSPRTEITLSRPAMNDALFADLVDTLSESLELKRSDQWLVVLLRTEADSLLPHMSVVMAELVADEAQGELRCRELMAQWSTGTSYAHGGAATYRDVRHAVRLLARSPARLSCRCQLRTPERRAR